MDTHALDLAHMQRALQLAQRGRGWVEPNPMVGCVIARGERVIGEGYHTRYGLPHAEREALAACRENTAGATAYVTLEPCCHTAKKTPPCVPALIEAGIARVVVACTDPNPAVAARGIERLRDAGIVVEAGLLEPEARQLNAAFFAGMLHHRPYVTLKWAQSADGLVAGSGGERRQISNTASMTQVHQLRSRCDAILVGIGTVLADDPVLTARPAPGVPTPGRALHRIVLDTHLRTPPQARLVQTAGEQPLLIYTTQSAATRQTSRVGELSAAGALVVPVDSGKDGRVDLPGVLADLGRRSVTHLLVEGGPAVLRAFMKSNLADRAWVFTSPHRIDAANAPAAPDCRYTAVAETMLDGDRLVELLNPRSEVFFAPVPSVDFALVALA